MSPTVPSSEAITSAEAHAPETGNISAPLPDALETFARLLAEEPRARVPLDRCRALFAGLPGGPPGGEPDPRQLLLDALVALDAAGRLRLPSRRSRIAWDRERDPALPTWVHVPRAPRTRSLIPVDLHPHLAKARDHAVGVRLPSDVADLDTWLKAHGGTAVELPVAERSFEIFADEKRLDAFLRTRFARQGGLTAASFRAYRVVEPFAMTAFDPASDWAVALENLASYDSVCRVVADSPTDAARPAGVIFGRGTQFMISCESLPSRLPGVSRVLYLGDLDPTGLEIPVAAATVLETMGVALEAWGQAYALLLTRPSARMSTVPREPDVDRLVRFLPRELSERTRCLLLAPARIAQEALTRSDLAQLMAVRSGSKEI